MLLQKLVVIDVSDDSVTLCYQFMSKN